MSCRYCEFKTKVSKHWDLTDLGEIHWYLGFEVKRDRSARTISINQQVYIDSMTEKSKLTNAKFIGTPMEPGAVLTKEQGPMSIMKAMRMRGVPYTEAIGSVLWPVIISRPDIAHAIGVLA